MSARLPSPAARAEPARGRAARAAASPGGLALLRLLLTAPGLLLGLLRLRDHRVDRRESGHVHALAVGDHRVELARVALEHPPAMRHVEPTGRPAVEVREVDRPADERRRARDPAL